MKIWFQNRRARERRERSVTTTDADSNPVAATPVITTCVTSKLNIECNNTLLNDNYTTSDQSLSSTSDRFLVPTTFSVFSANNSFCLTPLDATYRCASTSTNLQK